MSKRIKAMLVAQEMFDTLQEGTHLAGPGYNPTAIKTGVDMEVARFASHEIADVASAKRPPKGRTLCVLVREDVTSGKAAIAIWMGTTDGA